MLPVSPMTSVGNERPILQFNVDDRVFRVVNPGKSDSWLMAQSKNLM